MDVIKIHGGNTLSGEIEISGAKNAALPLMAASLLTDQELILSNLPHLVDITTMTNLLINHGVSMEMDGCAEKDGHMGRTIKLKAQKIKNLQADYDIVRKMRASVLVLGPLLARQGEAFVSLPGGCAIGTRPVDMHIKALEHMGAKITIEDGYIHASVQDKLKGADIYFDKVSVGATENILMAATLAKGKTVIHNAAKEPEITDLANCLCKMGAKIEGIGTDKIIVTGIKKLKGTKHKVIADRIETGTYMIAAAITKGNVILKNTDYEMVSALADKMIEAGIEVTKKADNIIVNSTGKIKATNITTQPHPGFPTDMQAQFMALMAIADGASIIQENIFENRFMHVPELIRMGADITVDGHSAVIKGVDKLKGASVMATDLRASVSLIIAGLVAEGTTTINRVYHLDRGYERIEEKLALCGAKIERTKEEV